MPGSSRKIPASVEEGRYGPKMQALTELQRNFVEAIYMYPNSNPTECARRAGYKDNGGSAIRVTAHNLWHDDHIQAAILEFGQRRLKGLIPLAHKTVLEVLENPQASGAERLKAAGMIYDRGGLHAVSEQKITHEHLGQEPDQVKRISVLARALGIRPEELLGRRIAIPVPTEKPIDVEFSEVVKPEDYA